MQSRISVIVPVFQGEPYIQRCLNCLLNQTKPINEIIIIDDGSTDDTLRMCLEYCKKYPFIKVIHQENRGVSAARNKGIEISTGDFLFFIDIDDVIIKTTIEHMSKIVENNEIDMVIGDIQRFTDSDDINQRINNKIDCEFKIKKTIELQYDLIESNREAKYKSVCGKLIRKELFNGLEFESGKIFEDLSISYLLYDRARAIADSNNIYYLYYENSTGITGTLTNEKRLLMFSIYKRRIEFYKKYNDSLLVQLARKSFLEEGQWILRTLTLKKKFKLSESESEFIYLYRLVLKDSKLRHIFADADYYDYFIIAFPKYKYIFAGIRKIAQLNLK